MDKRILGNDLEVSAIGLGCMGMSHAYGTVSTKKEAEALIAKAMDMGCTLFDTAEIYGSQDDPHHNERLLGDILKSHRNEIRIASKCGIRFDETATTVNKPLIPDGRPETVRSSIEGSLRRLQTDHLDLYYIHRKYHMDDIRQLFTEVLGVSVDLKDEQMVDTGCEMLADLMRESGVPLSLAEYGECPSDEYILQSLEPEDLGEFTPEEMCRMVQECYKE